MLFLGQHYKQVSYIYTYITVWLKLKVFWCQKQGHELSDE